MSEGMRAERRAELKHDNEPLGDHLSGLTADEVGELLAEVERLHRRARLHASVKSLVKSLIRSYKEERDELRARLDEIGETKVEWGQKYSGGGYLTRVGSDWMRERWPIEQWAWDNTRHGGVIGKRTIIVVEDWQDIRSDDLPKDRPANTGSEVPHA